jgi:arsenite methyltransferase
MPSPSTELGRAVDERYAPLASGCDSLSCGQALVWAAPAAGEVLVDLGCGRGQDVIAAADRVGELGQAIGIDRTAAMIEKARASVPASLLNVRFVCCDLLALNLPDGCADVVISNCTINHAADKAAVYREIHRVLRPGGRCVVSDVIAEQELPASVRNNPAAWAACYGGAIPESEYLSAIAQAGFAAIEILHRSPPYEKCGVMVRSLTVRGHR